MEEIDYNEIPVVFCKHCLSLDIKVIDSDLNTDYIDYCDKCGSTDIDSADIYTWEKLYEEKYNEKYLEVKKNGR